MGNVQNGGSSYLETQIDFVLNEIISKLSLNENNVKAQMSLIEHYNIKKDSQFLKVIRAFRETLNIVDYLSHKNDMKKETMLVYDKEYKIIKQLLFNKLDLNLGLNNTTAIFVTTLKQFKDEFMNEYVKLLDVYKLINLKQNREILAFLFGERVNENDEVNIQMELSDDMTTTWLILTNLIKETIHKFKLILLNKLRFIKEQKMSKRKKWSSINVTLNKDKLIKKKENEYYKEFETQKKLQISFKSIKDKFENEWNKIKTENKGKNLPITTNEIINIKLTQNILVRALKGKNKKVVVEISSKSSNNNAVKVVETIELTKTKANNLIKLFASYASIRNKYERNETSINDLFQELSDLNEATKVVTIEQMEAIDILEREMEHTDHFIQIKKQSEENHIDAEVASMTPSAQTIQNGSPRPASETPHNKRKGPPNDTPRPASSSHQESQSDPPHSSSPRPASTKRKKTPEIVTVGNLFKPINGGNKKTKYKKNKIKKGKTRKIPNKK